MLEILPNKQPSDLEMLTRAMYTWRIAKNNGDSDLARVAAEAAAFYTDQLGRPEKTVAFWQRLADPEAELMVFDPVTEVQDEIVESESYLKQVASVGGQVLTLAGLWLHNAVGGYRL